MSCNLVMISLDRTPFYVDEGENRGSYMSAHILLNLLNELGKRDKNARLAEHFISFSQRV